MIIEFAQRAIELSGQVRVSPKMKVALVAPVLAPLICLGADPLLNSLARNAIARDWVRHWPDQRGRTFAVSAKCPLRS